MYVPDNYDQFEIHDRRAAMATVEEPEEEEEVDDAECCYCGKSLWSQGSGVCIECAWYCDKCLNTVFRKLIRV